MLEIKKLTVGQMQSNCYIVWDEDRNAIIIDPGDDADYIISKISSFFLTPQKIIATHGHFDHNMAAFELQLSYRIPYLISEKDYPLLNKMPASSERFLNINSVAVPKTDSFLKEGKKIEIDKSFFKVMEIPGHTPGSIGLYNPSEKIFFSGDTLFENGSIGRYDFSYSSKKDIFSSIDRIFSLPEDTIIFPGHGNKTSVKREILYHR